MLMFLLYEGITLWFWHLLRCHTVILKKGEQPEKTGTRSVHVGSLSEVSKDTPNYTSV